MNGVVFAWCALRGMRWYVALTMACTVVTALFHVSLPVLAKGLIDAAASRDSTSLALFAFLFSAGWFVDLLVTWRSIDFALMKLVGPLRKSVQTLVMQRLFATSYAFFQNHFSGALMSALKDLEDGVVGMLWAFSYTFLHLLCVIAFSLVLVGRVNILFAYALGAWILVFLVCIVLTLRRFNYLAVDAARIGARIFGVLSDVVSNALGVKLSATHAHELSVIKQAADAYTDASVKRRLFMLVITSLQSLSFWVYQAVALWLLLVLFARNAVTAGDFALLLGLSRGLFSLLWRLSDALRDFAEAWGGVQAALETFWQHAHDGLKGHAYLFASRGAIEFRQVSFAYGTQPALFCDVSVYIPAGQKVGIVGYSGGGKTTFVQLLLRLHAVSGGSIYIDGQSIAEATEESLHRAVSYVPQEPLLFHRSIKENIAYGIDDASHESIVRAAKRAAAHDFIMQLPEGYESTVGERGTKLSGGQRQRIALARAFMRGGPILVLDEATSALDTLTEKVVQQELARDGKDAHTMLVIAHRLSTVQHLDRILVFDNGAIVQDGTHEELIHADGIYQQLCHARPL